MVFVKENIYATRVNRGFANSWRVLVFENRETAEDYVSASSKLGTEIIPRREVPQYHGCTVRPLSGQYLGIVDHQDLTDEQPEIPGYLGTISTCWEEDGYPRLYPRRNNKR